MMTRFFFQKIIATAALASFSLFAHGAINLADTMPTDPSLTVGKLSNGLTYYIKKNGKPENRVELRLIVKAGSVLEDDDQQGLAHLTEHMAFNSTKHFKKTELISYLQSIGVKFGADLNAYTSFDETVYMLPIPTDKKENLDKGFLILEDWAHGLEMKNNEIDMERKVVLEEARNRKGAGDRINKVLLPAVFNGSKYADRMPIGKEDIIKSFKYAAVKRFYADWYRPDLMAVIVVGDIDPAAAEKMIKAHFAQLTNPKHERPRPTVTINPIKESKSLVITDSEVTSNSVAIRYPLQAKPETRTYGDSRASAIKNITIGLLNRRIQELTQQAKPPFLGAGSSFQAVSPLYESFVVSAAIGKDGIATAFNAVVEENKRAREFGFTENELDITKKGFMRYMDYMYSERDKTDSNKYVGFYIDNFLAHDSIESIEQAKQIADEFIPSISLAEVNAYAAKAIPDSATKLVVYVGSAKDAQMTPTDAQLMDFATAAENQNTTNKAQKAVAASLMEHPPTPGSITAETQNKTMGFTELTLSNGVKVILKKTDFQNDQILLSANRFGGETLYGQADKFNAHYANTVAGLMGLANFTPTDIPKVLAGKMLSLSTGSGFYTEAINGSSTSSDIESLFQVLYLKMTSPRIDEDLFKSFIQNAKDATKNAMDDPGNQFEEFKIKTLYANHPRIFLPASPADFDKIDLKRSMQIYKERFGSAKGLTFILIGNLDLEKIKPLIATYLASLPTPDLPIEFKSVGIRPIEGVVKNDIYIGKEQKSAVSLTFTGNAPYSRKESNKLRFLTDVLNIKINEQLREKMGLIYSGSLGFSMDREPYESYRIDGYIPCAPENVDKVITALFAEIEKIKTNGPQQADLDKVKNAWLKGHRIGMKTNEYWLGYMTDDVLHQTDIASILGAEQRVDAITSKDIQDAAQHYFDMKNYLQIIVHPKK